MSTIISFEAALRSETSPAHMRIWRSGSLVSMNEHFALLLMYVEHPIGGGSEALSYVKVLYKGPVG